MDYLHGLKICHRDIVSFFFAFHFSFFFKKNNSKKLDNLVLDCKHNLKLIDFGFAAVFSDNEDLDVFW